MSIKLNVTDEDKRRVSNLSIEVQVLNNLLAERRAMMDKKVGDILDANSLSPRLYALAFSEDKWEAVLKPGSIAIPTPGTNIGKIRTN